MKCKKNENGNKTGGAIFGKYKKIKTISKAKTTKLTVKKLKAKKTYYFKVRAYKKNGKQKLFGTYSKVLKVKM